MYTTQNSKNQKGKKWPIFDEANQGKEKTLFIFEMDDIATASRPWISFSCVSYMLGFPLLAYIHTYIDTYMYV
jgi:hypothetical protein